MNRKPDKIIDHTKRVGLGDIVAAVAQPIAKAIDKVIDSDIQRCGGCAKRRAALNNVMPDIKNPFTK